MSSSSSSSTSSEIHVMVNGMPGPMATSAAEACLRKGLNLSPIAMTGPDISPCTITVADTVTSQSSNVKLIPSNQIQQIESAIHDMQTKFGHNNLLVIDFTHPSAVNSNAELYVKHSLPFVMGTTGGDRDRLMDDVMNSGDNNMFAVIAPNMAKQIVAMQAALEDLVQKYPSAFEGYTLTVRESHQKTKADTSGTAKAVIGSLKGLIGDDDENDTKFDVENDIEKIRNDEDSLEFGVPEEALGGHAFHTYTLRSADGSVEFQLKHNVAGRTVYAEGTVDAVKFLARKVRTEEVGRVYNMIDVLEAGAME